MTQPTTGSSFDTWPSHSSPLNCTTGRSKHSQGKRDWVKEPTSPLATQTQVHVYSICTDQPEALAFNEVPGLCRTGAPNHTHPSPYPPPPTPESAAAVRNLTDNDHHRDDEHAQQTRCNQWSVTGEFHWTQRGTTLRHLTEQTQKFHGHNIKKTSMPVYM